MDGEVINKPRFGGFGHVSAVIVHTMEPGRSLNLSKGSTRLHSASRELPRCEWESVRRSRDSNPAPIPDPFQVWWVHSLVQYFVGPWEHTAATTYNSSGSRPL
jgi:hypothetical protein